MKNFLFTFWVLISSVTAVQSQDLPPLDEVIKWSYKVESVSATEANVVITANLYQHFHLFSMKHVPANYDFAGIPTEIKFKPNANYALVGKVRENKAVTGNDESGTYVWHEKTAVFTQKIKLKSTKPFDIQFATVWQICNDHGCHMPQEKNITVKANAGGQNGTVSEAPVATPLENVVAIPVPGTATETHGTCELPEELDKLPAGFGVTANKLGKDQYELVFVLKSEDGWKVPTGKNGLFHKAKFNIQPNADFSVSGAMQYPKAEKYYDSVYKQEIEYYPAGSKFVQVITLNAAKIPVVAGHLSYEALSDKDFVTSEELTFTFDLKQAKISVAEEAASGSYWGIFFFAFISGFAALLTPCVFPMIPMTVSFFLKQSKNRRRGIRNALIYGFSIIAIYVLLGLGVTLIFGADALNAMSTNVYFNIVFFFLLVFFGASFLGAFEIRMPSSWINKSDSRADRGGLIGIFFMAFTLALVSFSCTGPIIGTLLVEATSKGLMGPFFGMLGFSLALALPFALFSAFPAWLNSMPQSGGWLNSVKVVLGFLEIALAFKFLSNADLVVQAHLLEREVFIALWIVIFAILGFYLMGKIKLSHDSDLPYVSVPRVFMSVVIFAFVVYMIPGLWGAPVKILSGFLPPQQYSEIPYGIGGSAPSYDLPEHAYYGPHGIPVFHDYDEAKAYADKINKPLMLDFTGHACINCRKMEDQVWSDETVKQLLIDSVVVVSLHVDEKLSLPVNKQVRDENGKLLTTVGEKWSYLQRSRYKQQTQPQYVMIDKDEEKLLQPTTYSTNSDRIENFKKWLDDGVAEYDARLNLQTLKGSAMIKPKSCVDPRDAQSYGSMFFEVYNEKYAGAMLR
jgi:thiol:disulfide interchange protein